MPHPSPGNIRLRFARLFMSGAYLHASKRAQGSRICRTRLSDIFLAGKEPRYKRAVTQIGENGDGSLSGSVPPLHPA